jgi:hypothetical protein
VVSVGSEEARPDNSGRLAENTRSRKLKTLFASETGTPMKSFDNSHKAQQERRRAGKTKNNARLAIQIVSRVSLGAMMVEGAYDC